MVSSLSPLKQHRKKYNQIMYSLTLDSFACLFEYKARLQAALYCKVLQIIVIIKLAFTFFLICAFGIIYC